MADNQMAEELLRPPMVFDDGGGGHTVPLAMRPADAGFVWGSKEEHIKRVGGLTPGEQQTVRRLRPVQAVVDAEVEQVTLEEAQQMGPPHAKRRVGRPPNVRTPGGT